MKKSILADILSPLETAAQPYLEKASDLFTGLGKRDQISVVILGCFLGIFILYSILWVPISNSVENAKKTYQKEYALLSWMSAQEANVLEGRKNPANRSASNKSLLSLVNNEAQRSSLSLKRYEPDGDKKLRVWLENVPFDNVILWLNTLSVSKGLSISSVSIDAEQGRGGQSKNGYVSVKVLFEK